MSKKITESMLKGLIEEVLKEEQLNEKKLDLTKLKDKDKYTSDGGRWDAQGWSGQDVDFSDDALKFGGSIDKIAKLDSDPDTLSPDETATAKRQRCTWCIKYWN